MADLETSIREVMLKGGVQALNLFRNENGEFQANVGFRDKGAGKIARHADPAKALALALLPGRPKPVDSQFEDLLG